MIRGGESTIHRENMTETKVYLSLGSNMGDRAKNLRSAIEDLPHAGVAVTRVSLMCDIELVDLRE
jgi:7,8-dihydro-6-hydroxymethylpterin-pyrophosphokinase